MNSKRLVDMAREWAEDAGFGIVSGKFHGSGPFELNGDPRDILVEAYMAVRVLTIKEAFDRINAVRRDRVVGGVTYSVPSEDHVRYMDALIEMAASIPAPETDTAGV